MAPRSVRRASARRSTPGQRALPRPAKQVRAPTTTSTATRGRDRDHRAPHPTHRALIARVPPSPGDRRSVRPADDGDQTGGGLGPATGIGSVAGMTGVVDQARRPVHWLREHPFGADTILAVLLAVLALVVHVTSPQLEIDDPVRDPTWWTVLLTLAATLPIMYRRRDPVLALGAVLVGQILCEWSDVVGPSWLAVLVGVYSLGAHTEGRTRVRSVARLRRRHRPRDAARRRSPTRCRSSTRWPPSACSPPGSCSVTTCGGGASTWRRSPTGPSGPSASATCWRASGSPRSATASPASCTTSSPTR